MMSSSPNNFGNMKISLVSDEDHMRYTRSVALLVAEAFLEPPNPTCDSLVILDGDYTNVSAHNLAWRPRGFAWNYTRQLKEEQPHYYRNLPVRNLVYTVDYDSIIQAGMAEGLLFDDIWHSTYTGDPVYPTGSIFEVLQDR
jgi:hypothetical protein